MVLSDKVKKQNRYLVSIFSFFSSNKEYAITIIINHGKKKRSILNQDWKNISFNVSNCKTSIIRLKLKSIRNALNALGNTVEMLSFMSFGVYKIDGEVLYSTLHLNFLSLYVYYFFNFCKFL